MRARAYHLLTSTACVLGLGLYPGFAAGQEETTADTEAGQRDITQSSGNQIGSYDPAFFAQFAPRNALDMLNQVPGFQVSGGGGGGQRGLGQANENVLVNGERLTSKSDSARDQLGRIPASNVVRIDIVEGTSLDIPGLTGQVANVIVKSGGLTGQFTWQGEVRTTAVDPEWYGGEISVSGSSGALSYTLALQNNNNRFGGEGPTIFADTLGQVIERQETVFTGAFDAPRVSAALSYDFSGDIKANLNLAWERSFFDRLEDEQRTFPAAPPIRRLIKRNSGAPEHEISGDIEFPFWAGRLKLIALEAYDGGKSTNTLIDTPSDGSPATGSRFSQMSDSGERIGRIEYSWPMLDAEWQLAGEAAFNRLDRDAQLFELGPGGNFIELEFPGASGGVREDRYEAILSMTKQLTNRLALQTSVGGEYSKIEQTGSAANARTFQRPKGSVSLAWQAGNGLDLSLALERRVGQLSFGQFLASVFLDQENENAGNNQLVPEQTWELQLDATKSLGDWGSTTLMIEQRWIDDYIDIIPLLTGGEGSGNVDKARRTEIEWATTLRLDPIGWNGAQLDLRFEYEVGEVIDQFDGLVRDFSGGREREAEIDFRHDIPGTSWAYGGGYQYEQFRRAFRGSEISRDIDGPTFVNAFIEHKDIFGLTVNFTAANLSGGRIQLEREVFNDVRPNGLLAFTEDRDLRIGPIFRLSVSGNF